MKQILKLSTGYAIGLITLSLMLGSGSRLCAQEQQRLERLNSQMVKDDAAKNHAALEKNARSYLEIAKRRRHAGLLAVGHFWLGRSLMGQEKYAESAQALETAYRYARKPEPAFSIGILDDLASVYTTQARYQDAEQTFLLVIKSLEAQRGANDQSLIKPRVNLANLYKSMRRYEAAAEQFLKAQEILFKQPELDRRVQISILYGLGTVRYGQYEYLEAEKLYKRSAETSNQTYGPNSPILASVRSALGLLYRVVGRMGEAEQESKLAVKIALATFGANHTSTASAQAILADLYRAEGRFNEAETLARQALETQQKIYGPKHPLTADSMLSLAYIYEDQHRDREALPLFIRTLEVYRQSYGPRDARTLRVMNTIGFVLGALEQYAAAEKILREALSVVEPDSYDASTIYANLAQVMTLRNQLKEAEPLLLRSLSIKENSPGIRPDDPRLTRTLSSLVALYLRMKDYPKARQHIERQITILEKEPQTEGQLAVALTQRAEVNQGQNRLMDAQTDLHKAMDLADHQRTQFSGGDVQRSQAFVQMTEIFERMVHLQTQLGNTREAYLAMERGRARGLLDQLTVQGVDLLQGVPTARAEKVRRRLSQVAQLQAQIEKQSQELDARSLSPEQERSERRKLAEQYQTAQKMYVAVQSEIRNLSPAYRLAVGQDQQPTDLTDLQDAVNEKKSLLLRYLVGFQGSYLLIVPAGGEPRLEKLVVTKELAEQLGIEPGALTMQTLNQAFANREGDGVLQLFRGSRAKKVNDQLTPKLAALWEVLIPPGERTALTNGTYEQLTIVPDGALAMLPFAALVVESEDRPVYALDVCPPMVYAPSATILTNLTNRKETSELKGRKPILTVGDPSYDLAANVASNAGDEQLTARARYGRLGKPLQSLPFSGLEAQWVSETFTKEGIEAGKLTKQDATERNVVFNIPGRRLVHLACHGMTDQSHGNLFGALAFSPVRGVTTADDGFLTLAEIYNLDMRGCEMTILSACDTNIGPAQIGEGVWALSRGFLVAGSRRVVASNWVVDDKAASSLISYYCGFLAQSEAKGESPDYAGSLQQARRWVREQEQWQSPYYWATFVHVGPN